MTNKKMKKEQNLHFSIPSGMYHGQSGYPNQNYSGVSSSNYSGVSAAQVAMGGSQAASQTSYVPSYAGQNAGSSYGNSNVSAANIAMSSLPKPTTNNPYTNSSNNQGQNYGGGMQNQNQGQNYGGGMQNQGQHNQNYGAGQNQGQNYGGGMQNQGMQNQRPGQNYNAGGTQNQNQGQNYGGGMQNQGQHNQNYGAGQNQGQNYGGGRPAQNQQYTATQNYGGGMHNQGMQNQGQNYGGGMQNQGMNQQTQYGTSAFQNQFAQMNISQQELVEQQRWFAHVDTDRSGTIDVAELSKLTFGGKPLHFDAAKKLMTVFDKDRNMSIDFAEYITLHKFIQAMQRAFNTTDSDRNGVLDGREIHHALQQAGFQLNFQAANALFHRHNKLNRGVDFVHFLEIAAEIALLRVEFDLKDHDRDGVITLRFDDLLAMVANV